MPRPYIPSQHRQLVIERARGYCEYCLVHEDDVDFAHQIDHLIALKHGGKTISDNLALSCAECNLYKGSDLTAMDPVDGVIAPLFSPRTQVWHEQFALNGALLIGLTPTGRATSVLLQMNDSVRVNQRQQLIEVGRYPPPRIT